MSMISEFLENYAAIKTDIVQNGSMINIVTLYSSDGYATIGVGHEARYVISKQTVIVDDDNNWLYFDNKHSYDIINGTLQKGLSTYYSRLGGCLDND